MTKFIFLLSSVFLLNVAHSQQNCEQIARDCSKYLNGKGGNPKFISDGQVYTAFLDREQAEFKTTLYGGSTYRIAASAGSEDDYVIFSIIDLEGNLIFTNRDHKNAPYWDFIVKKSIPVIIVTELDLDLKVTGCAVMLIGFKQ
jgi:hypothetical protein